MIEIPLTTAITLAGIGSALLAVVDALIRHEGGDVLRRVL